MTIEDVEKTCRLNRSKIFDYQNRHLIPAAASRNGVPDYPEELCQWISFIKRLQYAGISEDTLKRYAPIFQNSENNESSLPDRKLLLEELHDFLEERIACLMEAMEQLDCKLRPEQY